MAGNGPCVGCGQEVELAPDPFNESTEGIVKTFDTATRTYVTWHRTCRQAERAGAAGSLLPEPPRRRRRATEED